MTSPEMRCTTVEASNKNEEAIPLDVGEWETTDFILLNKLGSGSFCDVYKGLWRETPVAIKVLKTNIVNKTEFRKEFEILTKLHHPNVLQLFGISTISSNDCLMIIELMERSIQGMNATNTPLFRAIEIATDVARALAYLHNRSPQCVIHRDLKPQNVLLTQSGRAKLADFGISCFQKESSVSYLMTGETGTYRYMAPEVIQNKAYSSSVDIFSFAMLLYGLCENSIPYVHLDTIEITNSIIYGQRPKFNKLKNKKRLRDLITRCWDTEPNNRPTAIDVVLALQSIGKYECKNNCCIA